MIETKTLEAVAENATTSAPSETKSFAMSASKSGNNDNHSNGRTPVSFHVAQGVCLLITIIIVRSFWEFEDASRALAFYGVYHRYGWNQVIHFFGVPGIIWSLLVFMVHVPLPMVAGESASKATTGRLNGLNYACFLSISYNLFYLSIDPVGALLYAPVIYGMYASAAGLVQRDLARASSGKLSCPWYGTGQSLRVALVVHVLCWYVQIHLGHKIIEGAQPAVLQSLGGALSVAPLFAFYEGLWMLGINRGLQESTAALVDAYTQELCAAGTAMKACQALVT